MKRSPTTGRTAALLICGSLPVMAGAAISPSLPVMQEVFRSTPHVATLVPLVLTIPALFIALSAPFIGAVVDHWGRKPMLILSLALFALAGMAGLALDTLPSLLVSRAFLGLGVGMLMTTTTTLHTDYFSGLERVRFMGFQSSLIGLNGMALMMGEGLLADYHWRAPFGLYAIGWLLLPLVIRFIQEPRIHRTPVFTTGPEISLLTEGPTPTEEHRFETAMLSALAFFGMLTFYLVPVNLPFLIKELTGGSAARAGLALGVSTLLSAAVALFFRPVRQRISHRGVFFVLFLIIGVGYLILGSARTYSHILVGMVLGGAGFGFFTPNMNVRLAEIAPPARRGRWVGGLTACYFLGQFLSPLAAQPFLRSSGISGTFTWAGRVSILIGLGFAASATFRGLKRRVGENSVLRPVEEIYED